MYPRMDLGARRPRAGCQLSQAPLRLGMESFLVSSNSGSGHLSLASLGLQLCPSTLCFCGHMMAFPCVSVSCDISPSYKDTCHMGRGAHPNGLILTR